MTELALLLIPVGLAGIVGWGLRVERQFGRVDGLFVSIKDVKTALERIDKKVDQVVVFLLEQKQS